MGSDFFAILHVITRTLLVNSDGTPWQENIPVIDERIPYDSWPKLSSVKNPDSPVYQIKHNTYTNSEFPFKLDEVILNKIKGVKMQKLFDSGDHNAAILELMDKVTSVNQIHMSSSHEKKNVVLDDIFIPLPLMLEWISNEGYDIDHMSQDQSTYTFIFKK